LRKAIKTFYRASNPRRKEGAVHYGKLAFAVVLFVTIASASAHSSLLGWLGLQKSVDDVNAKVDQVQSALQHEMDETRKTVAASIDEVTKSVPGERYLRLIDDLNSKDTAKVQAAQDFLKSLAHIDTTVAYKLVVAYDYDENQHFEVEFNRFTAPSVSLMQGFIDNSATFHSPPKTTLSPLNMDDVRTLVARSTGEALDDLLGKLDHATDVGSPRFGSVPVTLTFRFTDLLFKDESYSRWISTPATAQVNLNKDLDKYMTDYEARRAQIVNAFVDGIMAAYSYRETRMESSSETKDWSLLDGKNFVIVFVDSESYDKQKDWHIKLVVRRNDKPLETLGQRPIVNLTKENFKPSLNPPIKGRDGQLYYWAYREMTGDPAITPEEIADLNSRREALKKWSTAIQQ